MVEVYPIIQSLAMTKGSNAKIEILKGLDDIQTYCLKDVVTAALDNSLSYYVTSIDEVKDTGLFGQQFDVVKSRDLVYAINVLRELSAKGSANNKDRERLAEIKKGLRELDKEVFDLIVRRDLKCGCNLSTFRKVWGKDFLPDFPGMMCDSYSAEKVKKNINFPAISQCKSDGTRAYIVDGPDEQYLCSRNGKRYQGLNAILKSFQDFGLDPSVLDGELVVVDEHGQFLPRAIGNGIINKSVKGTISPEEAAQIRFVAWDIIPYDVYFGHVKSTEPYESRFNKLQLALCRGDDLIIEQTAEVVHNLAEARRHYVDMRKLGEEGTILKNLDSVWVNGRPKHQVKMKAEYDVELEIIDWYSGNKGTKYEDQIGGFTVRSKCGKIQSNVGSGLSDEDRALCGPNLIGARSWLMRNMNTVCFYQG